MNVDLIKNLLEKVERGEASVNDALNKLKTLPYEGMEHATIDHHRALRQGTPEVIFGQGKSVEEIVVIMERLIAAGDNILVTRIAPDAAREVMVAHPQSEYHERARCLTQIINPLKLEGRGKIMVISAGTSDRPVAEEAVITARFLGHQVEEMKDVGVAGLHRLLGQLHRLAEASVFIVVAGMEGALPSVVGGLVDKPVIAVPTSVGYGASFGGVAALLGMLNSCASGISVVNIDNGYGAAVTAGLINRK